MKIVLYGTCSFPFLFREMILRAREKKMEVEWRAISLSWRHAPLYDGVLPPEQVFYAPKRVNELMREPLPPLDEVLGGHGGSIAKDIAADKDMPGQLRRRSKEYQLKNAVAHYRAYKEYLLKEKPDFVYFPLIETHDGTVLLSVVKELGIEPIFRSSARNLLVSFFSRTPNEDLPRYVLEAPPPAALLERARRIVEDARTQPLPAWRFAYEPPPEDLIPFRKLVPVWRRLYRFPVWAANLLRDQLSEPHAARPNPFWFQPITQFWWLSRKIMNVKGEWRRRFFDVFKAEQLPKKFVYFPLHVWPELSVTTMSPYFEDPLRAIDLVRFHMPADHWLVVKEHPAMKGRRRAVFYRALRKRACVLLADYDVPSVELVKRASVTVTVTGTAAFEALMMGRPSLTLGEAFFTPWVPRLKDLDGFGELLRKTMGEDPEEVRRRAVDAVARILWSGYDFIVYDPHDPEIDARYTMNRRNLDAFLDALAEHIRRLKAAGK